MWRLTKRNNRGEAGIPIKNTSHLIRKSDSTDVMTNIAQLREVGCYSADHTSYLNDYKETSFKTFDLTNYSNTLTKKMQFSIQKPKLIK